MSPRHLWRDVTIALSIITARSCIAVISNNLGIFYSISKFCVDCSPIFELYLQVSDIGIDPIFLIILGSIHEPVEMRGLMEENTSLVVIVLEIQAFVWILVSARTGNCLGEVELAKEKITECYLAVIVWEVSIGI